MLSGSCENIGVGGNGVVIMALVNFFIGLGLALKMSLFSSKAIMWRPKPRRAIMHAPKGKKNRMY